MKELLEENRRTPGGDYLLLEEGNHGYLEGFLIYGPTPMTDNGFDLYWIVVRKSAQRKGCGRKLATEMERRILSAERDGIVRIETSGKDDYAGQRHFYISLGYRECGRIKDFYHRGDDLVTYCKRIFVEGTGRNKNLS